MKIEKQILSDGKLSTNYIIKLISDSGAQHVIDVSIFKDNHRIAYLLHMAKDEEEMVLLKHKIERAFENRYNAKIHAYYDEDSNAAVCTFKLGSAELGLDYDYDIRSIMFINRDYYKCNAEASDQLAVFVTKNIIEAIADRK